jgi:hypothetical protein
LSMSSEIRTSRTPNAFRNVPMNRFKRPHRSNGNCFVT